MTSPASHLRPGTARIYNDETWELVATYDLAVNETTFINDVLVTKTAAYFTDTLQGQLYEVKIEGWASGFGRINVASFSS